MKKEADATRMLPRLDADNRQFWTGGQSNELRVQYCIECNLYNHPPSPVCPHCLCANVQARAVSGRAEIISYTVNHYAWVENLKIPYIIAYVGIEEQPSLWLLTNIIDCPSDSVFIGMKVRVIFEQHEDVWLPMFKSDAGK